MLAMLKTKKNREHFCQKKFATKITFSTQKISKNKKFAIIISKKKCHRLTSKKTLLS